MAEALQVAIDAAGPDDLILVTGSLYTVGAARAALRCGPEAAAEALTSARAATTRRVPFAPPGGRSVPGRARPGRYPAPLVNRTLVICKPDAVERASPERSSAASSARACG